LPEVGAAVSGGAGDGGECIVASCPGASVLGIPGPGCCQADGTCGVLIGALGISVCAPASLVPPMSSTASPPSIAGAENPIAGTAGDPIAFLLPERVVIDPVCPSQGFLGESFAGCCDQTGVCGFSTEPFASGGTFALPGFEIPLTCITAEDVSLAGTPLLPLAVAAPSACGGAPSPAGSSGSAEQGSSSNAGSGDEGSALGGSERPSPADESGTGNARICPGEALISALFELLLAHLGEMPVPPDGAMDGGDTAEAFDERAE
jgi:hypothetical protein